MKKKFLTTILTMTMVSMLFGCGLEKVQQEKKTESETVTESEEETATESEEKTAAEPEQEEAKSAGVSEDALFGMFETVTLDGEEADQSIFEKADLTMVNIWATYCQPCISEMPDLGELAQEYADKGVQIVGIIADVSFASDSAATAIVNYTKADYTHLVSSQSLISAYLSEVQVVPTTVFVDSEGVQVGEVYSGAKSKETWSGIIDSLLEQ